MTERIKNFFKGLESTMDVYPSDPPQVETYDPNERLKEAWERTGASLTLSVKQIELEQAS